MEIKCPKCNSDNVKVSGPYGKKKPEGEDAYKGDTTIYYTCMDLNCGYCWENKG